MPRIHRDAKREEIATRPLVEATKSCTGGVRRQSVWGATLPDSGLYLITGADLSHRPRTITLLMPARINVRLRGVIELAPPPRVTVSVNGFPVGELALDVAGAPTSLELPAGLLIEGDKHVVLDAK